MEKFTGKLEWRQIFSPGSKGKIHSVFTMDAGKIITVSGTPVTVRVFDINNGILLWELSVVKESSQNVAFSSWSSNLKDVLSVEVTESESAHELVVTEYSSYSGSEDVTQTFNLPWFNAESRCEFTHPHLLCLNGNELNVVDIRESGSHKVIPLTDLGIAGSARLGVTKHHLTTSPLVWIRNPDQLLVFKFNDDRLSHIISLPSSTQLIDIPVMKEEGSEEYLAYLTSDNAIEILDTETQQLVSGVGGLASLPDHVGAPQLFSIYLMKKQQGDLSYRFLISTEDHALLYGSRKDIYWIREESLASIIQVEMIDLPVTEAEVSIEEEFASDPNGMLAHTIRRLGSQLRQLTLFGRNLFRGNDANSRAGSESKALVRDRFGLHKLILVVTKAGKLFAMDTISGRIVWQRLLKKVQKMDENGAPKLVLFVQRTSIHYPLEAQCTILIQNCAGSSALFVFHPITGLPVTGDGYVHLGYNVQQAFLLPQSEETEFIKTLLMVDDTLLPHVFPKAEFALDTVVKSAQELFFYTADTKSCSMTGYSLTGSSRDQLLVSPVWKLQLCAAGEEIGSIVARHPEEKVHSQGRVLADRSVLYKYLNPNLVVVTTEGTHPHYRGVLNIYLIDVVSGAVVFSSAHRRVLGPVHVVHAENWVVYSYYNEKFRRTELASLELFEGKTQVIFLTSLNLDNQCVSLYINAFF